MMNFGVGLLLAGFLQIVALAVVSPESAIPVMRSLTTFTMMGGFLIVVITGSMVLRKIWREDAYRRFDH